MEKITLDEFIAEIESTFKIYADTNDIDRVLIKTIVINELRKFGKNICDKREAIVDIKNSQVLLPENFKSLILALKLTPNEELDCKDNTEKRLIIERQHIENPAEWTSTTRDYFVNYCESKIVTEKVYAYNERVDKFYTPHFLSLYKGFSNSSLDTNCLNLHPSIRDSYSDKISITNRTLRTNFREGKIYIQYNSLPEDEDGEIVIPILSTGDIRNYLVNKVKVELGQHLILSQLNTSGLKELMPLWIQSDRQLFILAKSEASWAGMNQKEWTKQRQQRNRVEQNRFNLPS